MPLTVNGYETCYNISGLAGLTMGGDVLMNTKFSEMGLSDPILKAVTAMGFEEATPIQGRAIPIILQGRDLVGQAQTGTGKTAAFGIPILERIIPKQKDIQALVVVPTRELAVQVSDEIGKLGQFKGVRVLPIYGGQAIEHQFRALSHYPHVICGTPGRLLDHINRKTLRLDRAQLVVIDEADEMLDMGFLEDIEAILRRVSEESQTLLFSATMPGPIQDLARRFLKKPEFISIERAALTAPSIEQVYCETNEPQKFEVFSRLLDSDNPELALVFVRTKRRVDELTEALQKRGYEAEGLHGDMNQRQRDEAMRKFREGRINLLVATDVAARGLDVSGITHVYNFDIPQDPESYVHRIGRTGRAGKTGVATTLITYREMRLLRMIEQSTKAIIKRKPVPTPAQAVEGQQRLVVDKILDVVRDGELSGHRTLAEDLLDQYDAVTLVAAALKMASKNMIGDIPIGLELTPAGDGPRSRPYRRGRHQSIKRGRR